MAGTDIKAKNIVFALDDYGIDAMYKESLDEPPNPGQIFVTAGVLSKGFDYPLIKQAIVSDRDFFGSAKKKRRKTVNKNQERIKSYTDLAVGDFVVHQNHGIGQFAGIVKWLWTALQRTICILNSRAATVCTYHKPAKPCV